VILPKVRDPRFITVRRGGRLQDDDHHLLAVWAADCAQHVLHHFERARPDDNRPRWAIDLGRAWARGEIKMEFDRVPSMPEVSSKSGIYTARFGSAGTYPYTVTVTVSDERNGAYFELPAEPRRALDVFNHPYAYAAEQTSRS